MVNPEKFGMREQPLLKAEVVASDVAALHGQAQALLKAHISGYTRKDGTFVKEHDDGRAAAKPKPAAGGRATKPRTLHDVLQTPDGKTAVDAIEDTLSDVRDKGGFAADPVLSDALLEQVRVLKKKYGVDYDLSDVPGYADYVKKRGRGGR